MAMLPCTTAQAERIFSKRERTLTAIRSSMNEDRVESLVLLQVHRDNTPSADKVVTKFAACHARRLRLIIQSETLWSSRLGFDFRIVWHWHAQHYCTFVFVSFLNKVSPETKHYSKDATNVMQA